MSNRHPRFLSRDFAQLLVVDIQWKLFDIMTEEGRRNLLSQTPILCAAATELGLPMLATEQYPKGIGPTIPGVAEALGDAPIFEKIAFAATDEPAVMTRLTQNARKQVILCGMETHICVYQTALGLLHAGYDVHVVADATATRLPHSQTIGLNLMREAGCVVTSTETVLFQLLEKAGTDSFKRLQKLIL
jgi:nicotinamidase-related amidase